MTRSKPPETDRLPADKRATLTRAQRFEWLTLALRISAAGVLYLALGSTQALNAIWLKSLWSLLPPVAFLAACRVERLKPRPRFPYGFYRAGTIAFLSAGLALSAMGLYLLYAGLRALIQIRHPELGSIWQGSLPTQWHGWPVIGALLYSILVPLMMGRSRQRLAIELHDKDLYADATMGQASWLAGSAAIVGVLGIGLGLWWADYVATLLIGADILRHGTRHLNTAVCDLIDEVPRRLGTDTVDPLSATIREHLKALDWVADVRVRLRGQGRRLTGTAFVCPHDGTENLLARFEDARAEIADLDWRLLNFELVPIDADRCARTFHAPR